jgi:hypothetical protein
MAGADTKPRPRDGKKPGDPKSHDHAKSREEKAEIVEVVAEDGLSRHRRRSSSSIPN